MHNDPIVQRDIAIKQDIDDKDDVAYYYFYFLT